mmetsp:Transcript_36869/g.74859  ORF Transcript_36869/g.74859 Transcript_36869/m.74859 type:complete len:986 (-) Transcript_36869:270-3227(-)
MLLESWEVGLLVFITYSCVFVPIRIARVDAHHCSDDENNIDIFQLGGDVYFLVELLRFSGCLQGWHAYKESFSHLLEGKSKWLACLQGKQIHCDVHRWLSLEFLVGVVATVPLWADTIALLLGRKNQCSRVEFLAWIGTLRTLRVLSVKRLFLSLKSFLEARGVHVNSSASRMIVIVYFFLIGVCVSGCAYLFVACPPGRRDRCRRGWKGEDIETTWAVVDQQMTSDWSVQFVRSVYFSMQAMFTVGYGDAVAPVSRSEVVMACFLMFVGRFAYSATTAGMSSLVANSNVLTMRFKQEMDSLESYMQQHAIPNGLQTRVKDYFEYIFKRQLGVVDTKLLLSSLPESLSREVTEHRSRMLARVPFFSKTIRDTEFVNAAAGAMEVRTYTPNSMVMFLRERQRELIIVTSGSAEIFTTANQQSTISCLLPGDFIGDQELLLGSVNVFAVRTAATFVEALVLPYAQLQPILGRFRDSVRLSHDDAAVQATVREHSQRTQKLMKLRSSVGGARKNRKVMEMMDTKSVANMTNEFLVIYPSSPFHQIWDFLKLIALLYVSIMIPLRIFLQCAARDDLSSRCRIFDDCRAWRLDFCGDYVVDVFFLVDMFLNYRCFAFSDISSEGRSTLQSRPEAIRGRYLNSSRCVMDVFASTPVDFFSIFFGRHSLLRLNRLLRIFLFDTYIVEAQQHLEQSKNKVSLSTGTTSVAKTAFSVVVIFHFVSVIWGILHFRQSEISQNASVQYLHSLYYVVTTFTTVGYGDIVPDDPIETAAAFFIGVFGALFAAAAVANVTASSRKAGVAESSIAHQKKCLEVYLGARGLGESKIHDKVVAYFAHMESTSNGIDGKIFLKDALPSHLYDEFAIYKVHKLVLCVPEFQSFSATCLRVLMRALQQKFFMEDEWVVTKERPIGGMYFVTHGHVQVLDFEIKDVIAENRAGSMFGNESLLTETLSQLGAMRWKYLAKSISVTMTWFLGEVDFRHIVTELYPGGQ